MPRISIWYVRTALLHFLLGVSVGAWELAASASLFPSGGEGLRSIHVHVLLVGWLVQLALGVATWILPFSRGVSSDSRLWGAWIGLNGGVLLSVVAGGMENGALALGGRIAALGAVGAILIVLWPRVRGIPRRSSEHRSRS